ERMIDQVLLQEIQEVEALVAMLENSMNDGNLEKNRSFQHGGDGEYGSDDEGYDAVLTDILSELPDNNRLKPSVTHASFISRQSVNDEELMDTTD
ncbi:MAG: hypothetical protein Q9177_006344, partial [Variospora cf. flavescens]